MSHHHHVHHAKHEEPHSEMVGALIALVVISIVFDGLFFYSWWVNLIKFILLIHLIKEIIHFLSRDDRKSYRYHTKGEDALHLWIATIIVSVVMSIIFNGQWYARIAPTVLLIKAVETSILAIITKNQDYTEKQQHNASRVVLYGQAQPELRRVIRVVTTDEESASVDNSYTESDYKALPTFCPMCGSGHDNSDRFCPSCGVDLRL